MRGDGAHEGPAAEVICKEKEGDGLLQGSHVAATVATDGYHKPDVMMRDKAETEADLGTRLPGEALGFSTPSLWQLSRRLLPGSKPRGAEFLVPVLLLRRRMRFRLTRSAAQREEEWGAEMAKDGGGPLDLLQGAGRHGESTSHC